MDEHPMNELRPLFGAIREAQDRALDERGSNDRIASRLIAIRGTRVSVRRSLSFRWAIAISLFALVSSVTLLLTSRVAKPLAFTVGTERAPQVGQLVEAMANPVPVVFSDGSEVRVETSGQARIAAVRANGANLVLEKGRIHTHVVPRKENDWSIFAGPFQVHVTGTRFDTDWSPESGVLKVKMFDGHVVITGACLDGPRDLRGEESGVLRCDAPPTSVAAPVEPVVVPSPPPPIESVHARPPLPAASANAASAETLSSAEVLTRGSREQLSALGESARHQGENALAIQTYRTLRERFPGTPDASRATFMLGRMVAAQGNGAEAEGLFADYVKEAPRGVFVEEAEGRLLELAEVRGDAPRARELAREYLIRHANGAFAGKARRILAP